MKHVLVLGTGGQIAQWVIRMLAGANDSTLTLFLRNAGKLAGSVPANARVVEGNVLQKKQLVSAMAGQDLVYANLTGEDLMRRHKRLSRRCARPVSPVWSSSRR